jgi:Tfp pilus assembly protein PilZ
VSRQERVFPRWDLHAAVDLHSDDNLYAGLSYDVSAGGIFVATAMTPPIGSMVGVTVTLPNGERLDLFGTVRWVRDPDSASHGLPVGCGIEWVALDNDSLRALLHFAEQRDPFLWDMDEAA